MRFIVHKIRFLIHAHCDSGKYDTSRADLLTRPRPACAALIGCCPKCTSAPCQCAAIEQKKLQMAESKMASSSESPERRRVRRRRSREHKKSGSQRSVTPAPSSASEWRETLDEEDAEWVLHARRRQDGFSSAYWESKECDSKAADGSDSSDSGSSGGAGSEPAPRTTRPLQPIIDYLNISFIKKRSVSVTIAKPTSASLAPKRQHILRAYRRRKRLQDPSRVRTVFCYNTVLYTVCQHELMPKCLIIHSVWLSAPS